MCASGDKVLIDVIDEFRSQNQDVRTVQLADVIILTVQIIRRRRTSATRNVTNQQPSMAYVGCAVPERRGRNISEH
ncbi:MAG: hypothetical protein GY758_29595 [Fuerstiella sp.]|nr:hypothetical protein [Fuerstiella sp.]MCP4511045.1 hypothetical protein [Fuerstiella sp.]